MDQLKQLERYFQVSSEEADKKAKDLHQEIGKSNLEADIYRKAAEMVSAAIKDFYNKQPENPADGLRTETAIYRAKFKNVLSELKLIDGWNWELPYGRVAAREELSSLIGRLGHFLDE